MNLLKRAWAWIKDHTIVLLAALISGFSAWLIYRSQRNKIETLEEALALQSIKMAAKAGERAAVLLEASSDSKEKAVSDLKKEISDSKRRALKVEVPNIESKSDDEVAKIFSDTF